MLKKKKHIFIYAITLVLILIWLVNILIYNKRSDTLSHQETQLEGSGWVNEDLKIIQQLKAKIVRPKYDVNCKAIFELDKPEIDRAKKLLKQLKRGKKSLALIKDEKFIFSKKMCRHYKKARFDDLPLISYEKNNNANSQISLAYSILVYNNVEQFERLLRLIYNPNNIYCIHIDTKSADNVKKAIRSIVDCFDNVFIATQLEYIVYAGYSRLKADINCLNDLLNLTDLINVHENLNGKRLVDWKYFFNLASSEFPLRTNYELTRILKVYNGSNEIEIIKKIIPERVKFSWVESKEKNKVIKTNRTKIAAPHNYTIVKGYAYVVLNRGFIEYALRDKKAQDLLKWGQDTWSPDEWYWATLQFNARYYPQNGFKDDPKEARINTIARFAGWYTEYDCKGVWRHGVCVFSIEDLPEMINRKHFFVNKFLLENDPISYQCMEEWFHERLVINHTVNVFYYCNWIKPHSTIAECL